MNTDDKITELADQVVENQIAYNQDYPNMEAGVKIITPIAGRRIMTHGHIHEIVAVQPMNKPICFAYRLQYRHEDDGRYSNEVVSHSVEAGSRNLQSTYKPYSEEKFNNLTEQDFQEWGNAFGDEVADELAGEVVADLRDIATHNKTERQIYPAKQRMAMKAGTMFENLKKQVPHSIGWEINSAASQIANATKRGAGNFAILGERAFNNLCSRAPSDKGLPLDIGTMEFRAGNLNRVGTLNDRIKLYTSSVLSKNEILIGYKGGNGQMDAGYIYCPYVPLMNSGTIINPVTFAPSVTFMTRYGKCIPTSQNGFSTAENYYQLIQF